MEAIRIVTEYKPSVFIWENVKGAFSSNNGADFWAIITAFANIGGYRLEWQLLNTSWFLPQNRERIYLVGHLTGRSEPGVFPFTENNSRINERAKQTTNVRTLTAGGHSGGLHSSMTLISSGTWRTHKDGNGFRENEGDNCPTIPARAREDGSGQVVVKVKAVLTPNRLEKRQNGRRFKEDGEPAFTLGCQDQHGVMIDDNNIRRLTEIECERLQGFPDDWTKYGKYIDKQGNEVVKEIPKTQRYKMCGNAVTTNVVRAIAERLNIKHYDTSSNKAT